ncbi:EamA family transporter [Lichenicoccus sp.]|uniref:EamA family transporter n=1 Tax=Lichenicoccus sp. TaxID=2781899 RepID=UPI003D138E07
MDPATEFGLLTALLYGVSDFVAKFSSRAVGVWRTLFWGELCSASLLTLWIALDASGNGAARAAFAQPWPVWAVAIASNMTILAATAVFYRALTIGRFSVVMPIVATYGAITALLSMLLGEPLGLVAVGGIAIAVLGAAFASVPAPASVSGPASSPPGPVAAGRGVGLASLAALLYGIGFCVQARYAVPRLGHLIPVWLYYVLGCALLGSVGRIMRRDLSPPRLAQLPVVLGTGLAASGAFVALTLAVTGGDVAVPTVLASLASVVTVLLARLLIKEQVAPHQWAGIAAVVFGLLMLHASPLHAPAAGIAAAGSAQTTGHTAG